jgi:hypothetical protein
LEQHRIQLAQMEGNTLRLTRLAAGDLAQAIEGARQLLTGLSQLSAVKENNTKTCTELFGRLLQQYPDYVNLGMIDYGGNIISSALQSDVGVNLSHHAYIRRALRTGNFVISGYQVETSTGKPIINFLYPVFAKPEDGSGLVDTVVFAALDLTRPSGSILPRNCPPAGSSSSITMAWFWPAT